MSAAYPFASSVRVEETLDVLGTRNIETTQQGLLQQILVATAVNGGGGGSSSPGLPVWTYTASAMAPGKLKTDSAAPILTTHLRFSDTANVGTGSFELFFFDTPIGSKILLTGDSGKQYGFVITAITDQTGYVDLTVAPLPLTDDTPWGGAYQVSFLPAGLVFAADTGWTANADSGSKTSVIPSGTDLDTIAAALDLLVTNAGTTLKTVAEKCKALEYALANNLRPNA